MRPQPLKVGVAGLGTVGAALVAQIARQREALAARCGRVIEVVAVCARARTKDRGVDLRRWLVRRPVALARDPGIDVFVELWGPSQPRAPEAALASGKSVVTANKALLASHGVVCEDCRKQTRCAQFRSRSGGAISDRQDSA
jgi:homoserine dehydrogenase